MKKILIIFLLFITQFVFASKTNVETYCENNKFGLIKGEEKITEAKYTKLIRLRDESWLFLLKNKYGIISNTGEVIVLPKYTFAQRYIGKYVKMEKNGLYGIFDEKGQLIIPFEYSSIDILYGRMFLVKKNYKYGLISFDGDIILAPIADDIYMPKPNILKINYDGIWYEIEQKNKDTIELPEDILSISENDDNFQITKIVQNPITSAGYGVVSISDYLIKILSSISPSYEQTIDELILGHGADTATILIKFGWLAKFPFVYTKNYVNNFKTPNNGPLSDVKSNLKSKMNDK